MSPVIYVGAGIAAIALLFALRGAFLFMFRWYINVGAFMAQIQKLIMANNVERAIKLCNAEPHALLPMVVKALLTRANRPYSLYLAQEEALLELRATTAKYRSFGVLTLLGSLAALGVLGLGLMKDLGGLELQFLQGCLVAAAAGALLACFNQMRLVWHMATVEATALKIRNLLYARQNYKPPQYEPVPMTAEEIEAWRESMNYVEAEAIKAGPGTAADLHDSQVNKKTGVLPPL